MLADNTVLERVSIFFNTEHSWLLGDILVEGFSKSFIRRSNLSWKRFLFCTILHQGCFYRKTLFKQFRYDESKHIASDYKLNLQLIKNKCPYLFVNFTIAIFFVHGRGGRETSTTLREMNQCRQEVLPVANALFFNTIATIGFYAMHFFKAMLPNNFIDCVQIFKQRFLMR